MIGTLSNHQGLIHTEAFAGSNTVANFLPFMMRLKDKCKRDQRSLQWKISLCIIRKHSSFSFDKRHIMAKYLPPQSCSLNPIEQVWNVIKCEWKKTSYMVLDISKKKEDQIKAAVERI
jgi:hypothetical protein